MAVRPTLAALLLLIAASQAALAAQQGGTRAPIRNLVEYEELMRGMASYKDVDLMSLVSTLMSLAELVEKYNASLAGGLREVAELLVSGRVAEALKAYADLLPYLADLVEEIKDVDPEAAAEIMRLVQGSVLGGLYYGGVLRKVKLPEPPEAPLPPRVNVTHVAVQAQPGPGGAYAIPALSLSLPVMAALAAYSLWRALPPGFRLGLRRRLRSVAARVRLGPRPRTPRDIVIYNYRLFLRLMEGEGVRKRPGETPRELLSRLAGEIVGPSRELTELFEKARYSPAEVSSADAARSDELLRMIRGAAK